MDELEGVPWRQAVERGLARLGLSRRWEVAILVALGAGELHSTDLLNCINEVEQKHGQRGHTKELTYRVMKDALTRMEADGLVVMRTDPTPHPSTRYAITRRGLALLRALRDVATWSEQVDNGEL